MKNPSCLEGITNGWYPPVEPVVPRVYHQHLRDKDKENIYGCACIGEEDCTHVEEENTESEEVTGTEDDTQKEDIKDETVTTEDDEDPQQPTE